MRVEAVSLNHLDVKHRKTGQYDPEPISKTNPLILGYDCVGIVEKIGTSVTFFKVGEEVFYAGDIGRKGTNA